MEVVETSNHTSFSIGDSIPYFCLPATDGKMYALSHYVGSPCMVVVFTSNYCPYAQSYEDRLAELQTRFKSYGVRFLAVCSNDGVAFPEDSFENMKAKDFPYPYLHDAEQTMARAFDAQATPEVFVFDDHQVLRYHGPIDDSPEDPFNCERNYLRDAIQAVLDGSRVPFPEPPLIGCSIKWKRP